MYIPLKGNSPDSNQSSFLMPSLKEQLDPKHPIYQLNDRIDWSAIDEDFKELYSHTGRPAKSVRLMVSLLLLKQLDDLSDEQVIQRWVEQPLLAVSVWRDSISVETSTTVSSTRSSRFSRIHLPR